MSYSHGTTGILTSNTTSKNLFSRKSSQILILRKHKWGLLCVNVLMSASCMTHIHFLWASSFLALMLMTKSFIGNLLLPMSLIKVSFPKGLSTVIHGKAALSLLCAKMCSTSSTLWNLFCDPDSVSVTVFAKSSMKITSSSKNNCKDTHI